MPPKKVAKKLHELAAELKAGFIINDVKKRQFVVGKQFATGGFGRIYTCNEVGSRTELVIKVEPGSNGPLFTEVNIFLRILRPEQISDYKSKHKMSWLGVPHVISSGMFDYQGDRMRYLIIPKYATSLENVREKAGGKLAPKAAMQVALAVVSALEYTHSMDYTHADVKAANILLEKVDDFSKSVLVDYGLARLAKSNEDKPDKKRAHNGTAIFTSRDAHRGCFPSYRGDVEILAYNLIYWLSGTLPWLALESAPDKVYEAKQKFVDGLPSTLKAALKSTPECLEAVSTMFDVADNTDYKSKIDFKKIKQTLTTASTKASSSSGASSSKSTTSSATKEVAKKTRGKAAAKVQSEIEEEEEKEDVEVPVKKRTKKEEPKPVETKKGEPKTRKVAARKEVPPPVEEFEEEAEEDEEEVEVPVKKRTKKEEPKPVETKKAEPITRKVAAKKEVPPPAEEVEEEEEKKVKPMPKAVKPKATAATSSADKEAPVKKLPKARKAAPRQKTPALEAADESEGEYFTPAASSAARAKTAAATSTKTRSGGRKRKSEDRESEEKEEEDDRELPVAKAKNQKPPGVANFRSQRAKVVVNVAKKIEKKYKRMSMSRGVLQPLPLAAATSQVSPRKSDSDTPRRSAGKGSGKPAKESPNSRAARLRMIPGVRNFKKGRRSMLLAVAPMPDESE